MKPFVDNLIALRKLHNMTQRQVAAHLGITQPSYIRYENGKAEPNIDKLILLADLFDVSLDYLCGRKDY